MRHPVAPLRIVIFGLSITSAWGNGHATTYRALIRALARRGHRITFCERERSWYRSNRDLAQPVFCRTILYDSLAVLDDCFPRGIDADLVMIGSYVPDGVQLAHWVLQRTRAATAFYDIDTPVTVARLSENGCTYLTPSLVPEFDLYLSFAGGPVLERLRTVFGARNVHPFYCSVDPEEYFPEPRAPRYDLAYLGTYSADRQPKLEALLGDPARRWKEGRFCVAGAQYPDALRWPGNVSRVEHMPPHAHRRFYNEQRFTLNLTRRDMIANGYAPSVRLFEAAACGVPIISDEWAGIEQFFAPGREILIARSASETLRYLRELSPIEARIIGAAARRRVLGEHTAEHRASQLETYFLQLREGRGRGTARPRVVTAPVTGTILQ